MTTRIYNLKFGVNTGIRRSTETFIVYKWAASMVNIWNSSSCHRWSMSTRHWSNGMRYIPGLFWNLNNHTYYSKIIQLDQEKGKESLWMESVIQQPSWKYMKISTTIIIKDDNYSLLFHLHLFTFYSLSTAYAFILYLHIWQKFARVNFFNSPRPTNVACMRQ